MESAVSWCAGGEKGCIINTREGFLKLGEGGRGATAVFSPVSQASPERRHFTQTPSAQDSTSPTLRKVRQTVSREPRPRDERHTTGLVFGPRQGSAPAFTAISTRPGADFRESPDLLCAPRRKQCSATEGTPSRPAVGALNLLTPFDVPPKCLFDTSGRLTVVFGNRQSELTSCRFPDQNSHLGTDNFNGHRWDPSLKGEAPRNE